MRPFVTRPVSESDAAAFVNDVTSLALRASELLSRNALGAQRNRCSLNAFTPSDSRRRRGSIASIRSIMRGNRLSRTSLPTASEPPTV